MKKIRRELTIMLKGDDLSLYSARISKCSTYSKAQELLQGWYTYAKKQLDYP